MDMVINGKPFKEWLEEQKTKEGALIIHRATMHKGYSTITVNGGVLTPSADKDLAYEDADMEVRINGRLHPLQGRRVERINGTWYVDGVKQDF